MSALSGGTATRTMQEPIEVELGELQAAAWAATTQAITGDPTVDPNRFCSEAAALVNNLPVAIRAALDKLRSDETAIALIRGISPGQIEQTPLSNQIHVGSKTLLAKQMAVVAAALGTQVGYEAECGGSLIQDLVPNPRRAYTQESQGSRLVLEAHTEQCFSGLRPDYLLLGCLRGAPDASTYALTIDDLRARLTEEEFAQLSMPLWMTRVDSSFEEALGHEVPERGPMPIVGDPVNRRQLRVDQDLMRGLTPEADALLAKVVDVYVEHRRELCLTTGDLLIIDNQRVIHGRSPFQARFDGTDRFLIRGFVFDKASRQHDCLDAEGRYVPARAS